MATQALVPMMVAQGPQPPSSPRFQCSISAVAKGIQGVAAGTLTITTADNHHGSGLLSINLAVLSFDQPISGILYYDAWAVLEGGRVKYEASMWEDKLILNYSVYMTTSVKPIARFEGNLVRKQKLGQRLTDGPNDFEFWYFPENVREVAFSIFSGEVISPGTDIHVYPKAAVHHDLDAFHIVRDGIHFHTKVAWERQSKFAATPIAISTNDLADGRYNLVVGELRTENKMKHLNQFSYVVEFVVKTPAQTIDDYAELRVAHSAQMRFRLGDTEHTVKRTKAIDRATNESTSFATDESGELVDVMRLLAERDRERFNRFGFVHDDLHSHVQDLPDNEMIDVVVWAHVQGRQSPVRSDSGTDAHLRPIELPDDVLSARAMIRELIEHRGGQVTLQPANEPYLYACIPKREVMRLAQLEQVGGLFHDDRTIQLDLGNSIMVAKSDSVAAAGYGGKGVHVAVHEGGPRTLKNLDLAGRYQEHPHCSEKTDRHSRLTHAIVKNVEPDCPHGHAPSCLLYSANSGSNAALEWALDGTRDCTVLSKSFHRDSETTSPSLSHDDILYDWKATRWPFPTFLLAAGNFHPDDGKLYVNHKGYNSLKVGNHTDDGLAMAASSEYRNPPSVHGDRELPEIAANGTVVGANDQLSSGTSFSAPAVAGIVALVQQVNPRLQRFPEACRAILLASASRIVVGGSWWGDLASKKDGRAGAGAVDAQGAMAMAQEVKCPSARPSAYGWDIGLLLSGIDTSDNPTSSPFVDGKGVVYARYYISVPSAPVAKAALTSYAVKAALTWNSEVSSNKKGRPTDSRLTVDLDLYVKDAMGRLVSLSASFDNNYEIVEFYVRPGDVYELSIFKSSGNPDTRYGIAWAVHEVPWAVKRP
ncbi:peptidase S8/S53 domain-containing protein [Pyrenochaeta sp. MPI-SDFR-AT-0127]|nr:peptidase S8/S53 domain-containing protein [Pyrenochaeta sp. MPI-SDFR-AT-0127]